MHLAITLSSLVYQSDEIFQSLPSQVWMRPVRAPSWSSQDTLTGCSSFSKPSCLGLPALRLRFSNPQRTCSPVIGFVPHRSCAVDRLDAEHVTIHFILISDQTYPCWRQAPSNLDRRR